MFDGRQQAGGVGDAVHALGQGIEWHGRVVKVDFVQGPQRLRERGGPAGADGVADHVRDAALVPHIHDGREQDDDVGDDGGIGVGLFLVFQRQGDVKIKAAGGERVDDV